MSRLVKRLIPGSVRAAAQRWVRRAASPDASQLLSALYDRRPGVTTEGRDGAKFYFRDPATLRAAPGADGLPVPPNDWRQGYYPNDDGGYLASGRATSEYLRSILRDHGAPLSPGDAVMDWGCASGRVLRHFGNEALSAELWGVDLDARLIDWAKENLSPPFRFVTCSAYPHLPFEDRKFAFIYALSVFTHIEHLQDLWLMELNRVMRPGGIAAFSVHNEYTVGLMQNSKEGEGLRRWLPAGLDVGEILKHEVTVVSRKGWEPTLLFFRSDWIRRDWGHYFDVLEIRDAPTGSKQPTVVLRKQ